jgi:hypothetical protein
MAPRHRRVKPEASDKDIVDAMISLANEYVLKVKHEVRATQGLEQVDDATIVEAAFVMIESQALAELHRRGIDPSAVAPIAKMVTAKARAAFTQNWHKLVANPAVGTA